MCPYFETRFLENRVITKLNLKKIKNKNCETQVQGTQVHGTNSSSTWKFSRHSSSWNSSSILKLDFDKIKFQNWGISLNIYFQKLDILLKFFAKKGISLFCPRFLSINKTDISKEWDLNKVPTHLLQVPNWIMCHWNVQKVFLFLKVLKLMASSSRGIPSSPQMPFHAPRFIRSLLDFKPNKWRKLYFFLPLFKWTSFYTMWQSNNWRYFSYEGDLVWIMVLAKFLSTSMPRKLKKFPTLTPKTYYKQLIFSWCFLIWKKDFSNSIESLSKSLNFNTTSLIYTSLNCPIISSNI